MTETRWEELWKHHKVSDHGYVVHAEWMLAVKAEGDRMQKKLQDVEKAMMDGIEVLFPVYDSSKQSIRGEKE